MNGSIEHWAGKWESRVPPTPIFIYMSIPKIKIEVDLFVREHKYMCPQQMCMKTNPILTQNQLHIIGHLF